MPLRPVTGIALLLYRLLMFVPHRKHPCACTACYGDSFTILPQFLALSLVLFYIKQNVSETGVRLQVEPTHLGSIDRASLCPSSE
jgi:hypothetical protein